MPMHTSPPRWTFMIAHKCRRKPRAELTSSAHRGRMHDQLKVSRVTLYPKDCGINRSFHMPRWMTQSQGTSLGSIEMSKAQEAWPPSLKLLLIAHSPAKQSTILNFACTLLTSGVHYCLQTCLRTHRIEAHVCCHVSFFRACMILMSRIGI